MTIAVRRSGFTIPLSLVAPTSTAMLLAGCQSGGASDANQQGTTGSSAKAQSTASAEATSGQKAGHASPRIPSPTGKGSNNSSAQQPSSGSQSRPASPRASEPRPAAGGNGATKVAASGKTDAPSQQSGSASKAPQAQGNANNAGGAHAGTAQKPQPAAPEAQKSSEAAQPAQAPSDSSDKSADKPADQAIDKPADAPADKDATAQAPSEPAAPADESAGQATSFVPDNLVSEKTAMIVSPSGNIGCDLSAHFAGCGVLSYRSDGTYGRDEAGSPKWWFDLSSGGTPQLGGRSEGAFSLDEAFRGGGASSPQVVEYGQSVTFGSWVCSSEETGMTCRNTETGHGVFLSSARYETF